MESLRSRGIVQKIPEADLPTPLSHEELRDLNNREEERTFGDYMNRKVELPEKLKSFSTPQLHHHDSVDQV